MLWAFAASTLSAALVDARGLIRDAEIEATLHEIAKPIILAAGLRPSSIRIIIVNDPSMNAFVNGYDTIFLHTGLLTRLKTVPMIQHVIAHEIGHIAAGHVVTRSGASRNSQSAVGIGMLLAAMAASAGGGEAAAAIATGSVQIANRSFLSHTRAEEAQADQASIRYMVRAGVDPQGAMDAMSLFRGQEVLSSKRQDPYARTHPLSTQRMAFIRDAVATANVDTSKANPNLGYWHARMIAKFESHLRNPKTILRRAKATENREISTYMKAIAYHRSSKSSDAHTHIDALIKARPSDPFYRETKGQFLLEAGRAKDAIAHYRTAAKLAPKNRLVLASLAHALITLDTSSTTKEAIGILERISRGRFVSPRVFQDMALGYARLGQNGKASLATAERFALQGRLRDAKIQAERALGLLPEGSPNWHKAQDIVSVAQRAVQ